jgi:hypothetical protein
MRVVFNKKTEDISFRPFTGEVRDHAAEARRVADQIQEFYDKNGTRVTGARVRTVVRNFIREEADDKRGIEGLSGQNLRGKAGGIYFVLAEYEWALEGSRTMLDRRSTAASAYLHFVPMADGEAEKEIIAAATTSPTRARR